MRAACPESENDCREWENPHPLVVSVDNNREAIHGSSEGEVQGVTEARQGIKSAKGRGVQDEAIKGNEAAVFRRRASAHPRDGSARRTLRPEGCQAVRDLDANVLQLAQGCG